MLVASKCRTKNEGAERNGDWVISHDSNGYPCQVLRATYITWKCFVSGLRFNSLRIPIVVHNLLLATMAIHTLLDQINISFDAKFALIVAISTVILFYSEYGTSF